LEKFTLPSYCTGQHSSNRAPDQREKRAHVCQGAAAELCSFVRAGT